jgi:hypothetical protein
MSLMAVENAVCETYDGLVEDCESARDQWNKRRHEIAELGLRGKGIDNELRCLQARFARSYALVRNHLRDCDSCQSARRADHSFSRESDVHLISRFRMSLTADSFSAGV